MYKRLVLIFPAFILFTQSIYGQVKIRLFSSYSPESVVFSVTDGRYELLTYNGSNIPVSKSEPVLIFRYNGRLAVKTRSGRGFICDSLFLKGTTGSDYFSVRINGNNPVRQVYSGDLKCIPDLGTVLMINFCDPEKYVAGVVMTEGGSRKNIEYFKTQAILARTYMYRYFDKHIHDNYNVCDNTHCQAYNGISTDTLIDRAVLNTKGLVILDQDSTLIISAFHSNCGGETTTPENVWLSGKPYLKSVADPYCITSRNASWEKRLSMNEWEAFLRKSGYQGGSDNPDSFGFLQRSRQEYYTIGSFRIPFRIIRSELNLRSAYFSVFAERDSVLLKGKGYGHGVGLCQEGAMVMAQKGLNYRQIIDFYYKGVIITDIKNALFLTDQTSGPTYTGGL